MLATCLPHLHALLPLTVCPGLPAPPGWQVPLHPTASLRCPSLCSTKGQNVCRALQCLFGSNIIKNKGCCGNGPRRKAGNKASLQCRRASSEVGLRDGEGCGGNKLCAGRERGDERRGECRVLQVGEGRAGEKHPHLSGEPPGWPGPVPRHRRINLLGVHHTQEQLTLLTPPSTAPSRSPEQALPPKQSSTAETRSHHPGTAGRDMVWWESRGSVGAPGPGEPQNSPEHPAQLAGSAVKGRGLTPIPVAQGWVSLCAAMALVTEPPSCPQPQRGRGWCHLDGAGAQLRAVGAEPAAPKPYQGAEGWLLPKDSQTGSQG